MGKEAACAAVAGPKRGPVKAHLDGERLRVSGALRLNVPLGELRELAVRDGALSFEVAGERITLELGARAAAAWARDIANPKSLLEKLGVKPGQRSCVLGLASPFVDKVTSATGNAPVRENAVRAAILAAGLVDTKVVSFSATHTAAKAVIPVAQRS